jgi:ubiquinone/menaquinone biosynthesis C-methylase UbiE
MELPLWTPNTTIEVSKILHKGMRVYEFGSGFSTLWVANRVGSIVTLEHSAEWYLIVNKLIAERGVKNVHCELRDIRTGDYMTHILSFPDGSFDFVIVDCAFRRVEAMQHAINKVVRGGYILLDDSQAFSWQGCFSFVPDFGIEVHKKIEPDESGKTATIFRRL